MWSYLKVAGHAPAAPGVVTETWGYPRKPYAATVEAWASASTVTATTTVAATAAVTPATTITATITAAPLGHRWVRHAAHSNHAERLSD
jgi:hypothetical protein